MNKKYTKWIPLGKFSYCGSTEYVVMARRNKITGMLKFKSIRVNPLITTYVSPILPKDIIDVKRQWEKLISDDLD